MMQHQQEPRSADPAGSAPGLENHLRNLILTNASTQNSSSPEPSSSQQDPSNRAAPVSPAGPTTGVGRDNASSGEQREPQSPRGGRKRLNQAQRRQMSSQLSIQIDPRAFDPLQQPNTGYESPGRQQPPSRHPRGHQHSHTVPGSQNMPSYQGSWHVSQGHSSVDWSNNSGTSPRRYNDRSAFRPEPTSPNSVRRGSGRLFNPRFGLQNDTSVADQAELLNKLCYHVVSNSEIERSEIAEKEDFRQRIEGISREVISRHEQEALPDQQFPPQSVQLKCFGSLSSGFATKSSDMDLGLLSPLSSIQPDALGSPIPRLLEKALLEAGLGARLLTRTRVPIIKLCENPPEKLRQDLLAHRKRWEDGVDNDAPDGHEEYDTNQEDSNQIRAHPQQEAPTVDVDIVLTSHSDAADRNGHVASESRLQQSPNSSLSAYYGLAKRTLRRDGGRDVTLSNFQDFTSSDWEVLNNICRGFIEGLADNNLRDRISQYPSLSFKPLYNIQTNRSLYGCFLQVEGEQILHSWNSWTGKSHFQEPQSQVEPALRFWTNTQHRTNFGQDPVSFNKDLQIGLEKIKKISTVQLLTLEQSQHETASQYLSRAKQIAWHLQSTTITQSDAAQRIVIDRYIVGVYNADIRGELETTFAEVSGACTLNDVGRRHKCLQLALELRKAAERNLYDEFQVRDIDSYIDLLRSPLRRKHQSSNRSDLIIPIPSDKTGLFDRIRTLQDPHTMAPNQPRDRYRDHLEFPKNGAGVQCDINFSAHLALHNTTLLRCYSHTDPRVRPMVLFVKHWAKRRGINSGYRGTLSSYGYVLMVLHYLVNVAQPFVCPNLQQLAPPPQVNPSPMEVESTLFCKGHNIQFWRNEPEIMAFSRANQLNQNNETIGHLLRGFFEYFAQGGYLSNGRGKGFDWGRDVLSLRTQGGLLSKQTKGWTGAKTVIEIHGDENSTPPQGEQQSSQQAPLRIGGIEPLHPAKSTASAGKGESTKEVRHRYLFAIEDPFELDHNVARTVTHNGIVSIRDEFRRAWRIIRTTGRDGPNEDLLRDVNEGVDVQGPFLALLDDIHGIQAQAE